MRHKLLLSAVLTVSSVALTVNGATAHAASLSGTLTHPVKTVTSAATDLLQPTTQPVASTTRDASGTATSAATGTVNDVAPIASSTMAQPMSISTLVTPTTTPVQVMSTVQQPAASSSSSSSVSTSTGTPNRSVMTLRSTAAQSAALANGQAIMGSGKIDYGSNQISQATANMLYRGAAVVSIVGFILYAVSSVRRNHMPVRHSLTKVTR